MSALPTKTDYKELLKITICNIDNWNYMLHGCENCQDKHVLKTFLTDLFENEDDRVDFITITMWWLYWIIKSFITKVEWASFHSQKARCLFETWKRKFCKKSYCSFDGRCWKLQLFNTGWCTRFPLEQCSGHTPSICGILVDPWL